MRKPCFPLIIQVYLTLPPIYALSPNGEQTLAYSRGITQNKKHSNHTMVSYILLPLMKFFSNRDKFEDSVHGKSIWRQDQPLKETL